MRLPTSAQLRWGCPIGDGGGELTRRRAQASAIRDSLAPSAPYDGAPPSEAGEEEKSRSANV